MPRLVQSDQTFFFECITVFRNEFKRFPIQAHEDLDENLDFILSPFQITKDWNLGECTIFPSLSIQLSPLHYAFINLVKVPDNVKNHYGNQYCQALAAILTFITSRPFKGLPRREFFARKPLDEEVLKLIGINHPISKASGKTEIDEDYENQIVRESYDFIKKLLAVPVENYVFTMQSIRMIQLSLFNKKEDYGLAYSLIVASIEAIAQKVFKRNDVKPENRDKEWTKLAKDCPAFGELFEEYKKERGDDKYLKQRYIKFILLYTPKFQWKYFVEHPLKDFYHFLQAEPNNISVHPKSIKFFSGINPDELSDEEIIEILGNSYKHRSEFFHLGQQPPHGEYGSGKQFFQEIDILETIGGHKYLDKENIFIVPNYELLNGIAKNSILTWLNEDDSIKNP